MRLPVGTLRQRRLRAGLWPRGDERKPQLLDRGEYRGRAGRLQCLALLSDMAAPTPTHNEQRRSRIALAQPAAQQLGGRQTARRHTADAHGIGEPANVATASAVANAVYNAIGVRIRELPMTPRTVLAALRKGKS